MSTREAVINGWSNYYAPKIPVAVTFVFNWSSANANIARTKLKQFHRYIDEDRFGPRFYQKKPERRLDFLVAPEKFQAGHPHYHGLMSLPVEELERHGIPGLIERYQAAWKAVVPAGHLDIKPVWDVDGWIAYSSKENSLSTSDLTVWSLSDFPPSRA